MDFSHSMNFIPLHELHPPSSTSSFLNSIPPQIHPSRKELHSLVVIVLCVIVKCDCYEVVELSGRCLDLKNAGLDFDSCLDFDNCLDADSYLDADSCLDLDSRLDLDLDSCIDLENTGLDLGDRINLETTSLDLDSSLNVEFCLTSTSTAPLASSST
jgi:hypothetical protein